MSEALLHGIVGYLITPLDTSGRVDTKQLSQLTEAMIASGIPSVSPVGSTGILPLLTDEERDMVVDTVCRQVSGRVPVLVGTSSMTTGNAIRHARYAERAGASALLISPLAYWKLTEQEIFDHYDAVASAVSLPIMAYNNPSSGTDMSADLLLRLAEIPNVTMVKESTGDLARIQHLLLHGEGRLQVFIGKNTLSFAAFALGCHGWCSAAAQIAPRQLLAMHRALVVDADLREARRMFRELFPLLEALVRSGLARTIPAALELLGQAPGPLRLPLQPIGEAARAGLAAAMRNLGLLDAPA